MIQEYSLKEKCKGLCHGTGTVILSGYSNKALMILSDANGLITDALRNGRNTCPRCKGSGVEELQALELETEKGE